MATMMDVARKAGVSVATVSHVLNDSKTVSDKTSRRVRAAAEELGYHPNRSARALRKGYSQTLGLLFPDLRNPFFSELVYAVEEEARRLGYSLILVDTSGDETEEELGFTWLNEHRVAGAIWIPSSGRPIRSTFPVVCVDRPMEGLDQVYSDHYQGGRLIARHAIESGHRAAALISGPREITSACLRRNGFLDGIGTELSIAWEAFASFSGALDSETIERLGRSKATFIFASNDMIAMSTIRALTERGFDVPGDVSVAGFDDVPWAGLVSPSITTVHQDIATVGREAVRTWVEGIAHPRRAPVRSVLPVELVQRASTRSAP